MNKVNISNESNFKATYFTNNFYWIDKENYEILQKIGLEMGCVDPSLNKSTIKWHDGFKNLGFRSYKRNNYITKFQKEPFLLHNEKATDFEQMMIDYKFIFS